MKINHTIMAAIAMAANACINMHAQEQYDSLETVHLGNIVITANHTATLQRLAPAHIQVTGKRLLNAVNAECVADALSYQPGVRVEDDCSPLRHRTVAIEHD